MTGLEVNDDSWQKHAHTWDLTISFPDEVRIITQSKDVDIHLLIGNIGGYLGLFLGKQLVKFIEI